MKPSRAAGVFVGAALGAGAWHVLLNAAPPTFDDAWYLETSFRLFIALKRGVPSFASEYASAFRIKAPLVIGWGRNDRVGFTSQAKRAMALFPDARLHWFERCGHFPHWEAPQETVQLILQTSARQIGASTAGTPVEKSAIRGALPGADAA